MVLKNFLRDFSNAEVARGGINISCKADAKHESHDRNTNIWSQTPFREVVLPRNRVMHNSADIFPVQLKAAHAPIEHCDRTYARIQSDHSTNIEEEFLPLKIPDKEDDSYLVNLIEHLRNSQHAQIQLKEARKLKGGWEGWAQTEMAIALQRKYQGQTKIWRDQAVYEECPWASRPKQVDLWMDIEPRDARNGIAWFGGVEMKCENASMRSKSRVEFSSQVISDINAIKGGIKTELYPKWEKHACASKYAHPGEKFSRGSLVTNYPRDARLAWQEDKDSWLQTFENQLYEGSGLWGKKVGTVMYAIGITGYPDSLLSDHWHDTDVDLGYCPLELAWSDESLQNDYRRWKSFNEARHRETPDQEFEWKQIYIVWWKKVFLNGAESNTAVKTPVEPEYEIEKRLERWESVKQSIYDIIPEDHLSLFPLPSTRLNPVHDYLRPETREELELIDRLTFAAKLADQVADNLFIFSLYSLVPLSATSEDYFNEDEDFFRPRLRW